MAYPQPIPFTGLFQSYDDRILTPIFGRCLLVTNSVTLEFLDRDKRFVYPLPVPYGVAYNAATPLGNGFVQTFIIEAHGYLLTEKGAYFNIVQTDEYKKFFFLTLGDTYSSFAPFIPLAPPPPPEVNKVIQAFLGGPYPGSSYVGSAYDIRCSMFDPLVNDLNKRWFLTGGNYEANPPDPTGLSVALFLTLYTSFTPSGSAQ